MLASTKAKLLISPVRDNFDRLHNRLIEEYAASSVFPGDLNAAVLQMVDGLNRYAQAFRGQPWNEDATPVGVDNYASPYILDIGKALIGLLAVDGGRRMNCGQVNHAILEILHSNGYTDKDTD